MRSTGSHRHLGGRQEVGILPRTLCHERNVGCPVHQIGRHLLESRVGIPVIVPEPQDPEVTEPVEHGTRVIRGEHEVVNEHPVGVGTREHPEPSEDHVLRWAGPAGLELGVKDHRVVLTIRDGFGPRPVVVE